MPEPRFEGCEVVRQLRAGPATDWYLARQSSLKRSVVIKSLSAHLLPESPFAEPLGREAQLLGRLRHENLIQLYDFKKQTDRMWLVLEYVDGWTLEELLTELARLPVPCALAIAREVIVALAYVHSQGVVHRDLRPRNVLVSKRGEVKLTNFYFAAEDGAPPLPELLEGDSGFPDLSYMSPEQILGEPLDARSDLFSAGVILYEMLTGRRPFEAEDNRTTAQRIRHEPPSPMSESVGVPPSVERILQRALGKLAPDRFADASEMLFLVDKALAEYGVASKDALLSGLSGLLGVEAQPVLTTRTPERSSGVAGSVAVGVYLACMVVFMVGIFAIQKVFGDERTARIDESVELPLTPKNSAFLRTVVRPWAHVYVDGQLVETTPFAHPIPLSPGVHYLRFEHPATEPVARRVEVLPGQNLLLEIDMPLPSALPESPEELLMRPPKQRDAGRSP